MNKRNSYINRKYFRQLLSGLTAFLLLLYLPFSVMLMGLAQKSIRSNIAVSNQTVLKQLKHNYSQFTDNIKSLSSNIFWDSDIQRLLYGKDVPFDEIYHTLFDLMGTYMSSHPNLHSICLYNKYSGELYAVSASGQVDKQSFMDYVSAQENIPILRPMLHKMSSQSYTQTLSPFVFSYFIYQFNDPSQEQESFLVLNQYANQAVSTIETISGADDVVPTATYYVTTDAYIASKPLDSAIQQDHEALLESFRTRYSKLFKEGGSYEETVGDHKYLVTYAVADPTRSALVIIQDYAQVFGELFTLQRNFLIVSAILFAAAVLLALRFSRRLYQPINTVLDTFVPTEEHPENTAACFNELDFMKNRFEATAEQKKRLESRENRYQPIAQEYSLRSLLLKSDGHAIEKFQRVQPNHWLNQPLTGKLEILLFRPFAPASAGMELPLLLYAVQNIAEELLLPHFQFASFKYANDTFGMVLMEREGNSENLHTVLTPMQLFMKEHFGAELAVAQSGMGNGLPELSLLLQQADLSLSYTFLFGPVYITPELYVSNEKNEQTAYSPELDIRLEDAIAKQDLARCQVVLAEIQSTLQPFSNSNATICTAALLNQVNRFLTRHIQPSTASPASSSFRTLYSRLSGGGTMEACFADILSYIASHLSDQAYEDKTSDQLFVDTILEFIQNSYYDVTLSSQLIADYLGLSDRYLMKKFKSLTNLTLAEYITDFRMKKAASLLENTQESISSIALQVGIENLSYFYRLFKKAFGSTPKEYREVKQGISLKSCD